MAVSQNRYIGICSWFAPGDSLEQKIQFAKACGLDGIELDFNHQNGHYSLSKDAAQSEALALKNNYQIDFPALAINSLCEFGMSEPAHWDEVKRALDLGIACAANLSIPIVQLPSFFAGDIENVTQFQQTVKAIQYACDLAAEHGIVIGSENAMEGDMQIELISSVYRCNFKIYFDSRNSWRMKGIPSAPILRMVMPHVCEVHLKDGIGQQDKFTLLGQGDVGIAELIDYMNESDYRGRVLLENDYNQFAAEGLDPIEQAKEDIAFIRSRLQ